MAWRTVTRHNSLTDVGEVWGEWHVRIQRVSFRMRELASVSVSVLPFSFWSREGYLGIRYRVNYRQKDDANCPHSMLYCRCEGAVD